MNGLIMAAQLIAGLAILVTLHELGHFIAARAFGIKVEKFFLFFDAWNFKLFSFKIGDTEYGMGWLPLGGYVKIAGMIDESMDVEQMKQPAQPWEFRSKPAWQRLIVMLGGITVNLILGGLIFWMLTFSYGETYIPASEAKYGIVARDLAKEIGLQSGDKVLAVNDRPMERFNDLWSSKVLLGNAVLKVQRGEQILNITVPSNFIEKFSDGGKDNFIDNLPRRICKVDSVMEGSNAAKAGILKGDKIVQVNTTPIEFQDEMESQLSNFKEKAVICSVLRGRDTLKVPTNVNAEGKIGIFIRSDVQFKTTEYGFFAAFPVGINRAYATLSDNIKGLGKVISGEVKAQKALQGPIGIAAMYGSKFDWARFWTLTGILSLILAFMNVLPIPALDGGHTLFLIIEMIIGRPLSDKFMERAQMVGFIILIGLMVFVFGNDIFKLFK